MIQAVCSDRKYLTKQEARHEVRVSERLPVNWSLKGKGINGTGKVCNISASGMLLEAKTDILPDKDCVLELQSLFQGQNNTVPSVGRLVWSRSKGFLAHRSLWGIEFVDPQPDIIDRLHDRIQQKVESIVGAQKVVNTVGWVLLVVMTILAVGILAIHILNYNNLVRASQMLLAGFSQHANLYNDIQNQYRILKAEYLQVSKDLEETKMILPQLQSEKGILTQEIKAVKARLKRENRRLWQQLQEVKVKLDFYEGKVNNMDDARRALTMSRMGLRSIKTSLRRLKHEAYVAKIEARQERDRILLSLGNRGLVMKDGKPFQPDFPPPQESVNKKKIRIDIDLVD